MRLRRVLAVAAVAALTLAGCSSPATPEPVSAVAILQPYGLENLSTHDLIDHLDQVPLAERPQELRASVRPTELLLTDTRTGASATLPIPSGEFYLSVAAYRDGTHDCFFHSLTTCRGELGGQEVHLTVTDQATGTVLADESRATFDNGFVGLWLPAGIQATLRIEHDGDTATAQIGTGPDDPTCLTTLRLT